MKNFTTLVLFLFFLMPLTVEAQFCCCPICPAQMISAPTCISDINTSCVLSCLNTCGIAIGASSTDASCTGTDCAITPVSLTTFNARTSSEIVELLWETEMEQDNEGFEVQRMSGINWTWETIGFVSGVGTTNSAQNYSFEDRNAPPGMNYYRLRQVDFNDVFSISEIKSASLKADDRFSLWPTLAKDQVVIRLNQEYKRSSEYEIFVFDMMGRVVEKNSFQDEGVVLDISNYQQGNYIVNITSKGITNTLRFMKAE